MNKKLLAAIFVLGAIGASYYYARQNYDGGRYSSATPNVLPSELKKIVISRLEDGILASNKDRPPGSAREIEAPAWDSFRIPDLAATVASQNIDPILFRALIDKQHEFAAEAGKPAQTPLDDKYLITRKTKGGSSVEQVYIVSTDALSSERWEDPAVGKVIRFFHPEFEAVSLSFKRPDNSKVDFVSIPSQQTEYLAIESANTVFASFSESGKNLVYFNDIRQRRLLEYDRGRARQFDILAADRLQEIDEKGKRRLGFYKMVDGVVKRID